MSQVFSTQNKIAIIWDFDKTLIPGYMQQPIFERFEVDEYNFWNEVNTMAARYKERGYTVSGESVYLNHILTYAKAGRMPGLNNKLLRKLGKEIVFYEGLPGFFEELRAITRSKPEYARHDIQLEHYIVSTGLAEMIRGSAIAPYVDGIWGSEFIENPLQPGYLDQEDFPIESEDIISQIGTMIDNTTKTRALFEINKGSNKNETIDVNAKMPAEDRRIPFQNMIYIADGPSDVPSFSVIRKFGGKAYAVYKPGNDKEFEQNDQLLQTGRIHAYGPARYSSDSNTSMWLRMHVHKICQRIVSDREVYLRQNMAGPPRHLKDDPEVVDLEDELTQDTLDLD
ncbi:HAD family hydrolase [Pelagicoccus sp. SDUM812003]|uniref:HAD family hydrolase n=1 Tax=Pelagicoccus sp. SDUM812003 TaxID=3041267 RepID=UPI00280F5399|nr:HAD family hydrolase [Pelagicoccus sp. SDUM812003]MDQ8205171.1 HAD family hydrolase [Pelagicoccus sp. SDUM812003]